MQESDQPGRYFEQIIRVLSSLARLSPLILLLDDLQWVDDSTLSLLFHLGRRLQGLRMMVICAYRPANVGSEGCADDHALEIMAHEFQRDFGDIILSLDRTQGQHFVGAYLDRFPHRLPAEFIEKFYQYTGGRALFTVEFWREMLANGGLIQDQAGRWIETDALDWNRLPERLEAVILTQLECMPSAWRRILEIASVEGEVFTLEVLARAGDLDQAEVLDCLSGPLSREQNLVRAHGVYYAGARRLSYYRFRHVLIQRYIYTNLDAVQRSHIHRVVGLALEDLLMKEKRELDARAAKLARHFEAAGLVLKAVEYLLRAGHQALRRNTAQEAADSFQHGLELLADLSDPDKIGTPQSSLVTDYPIARMTKLLQASSALAENLQV